MLLPQVGLLWSSYVAVFLGLLMFFVSLTLDPSELARALRSHRIVLLGLFTVFVVPSLLALLTMPFLPPVQFAAVVLALSTPSAISAVFWCDIFRGNAALALVLSVITNLLSIVTIPLSMMLIAGMAIQVNVASIFTNLLFLVVVPLSAGQLVRKVSVKSARRLSGYNASVQLMLLVFLLWGAVAPGAVLAWADPEGFALFNALLLGILGVIFAVTYVLGRRFGQAQAVALSVASSQKNATLALVIGSLAFGSGALLPLIANLIAQNVFLVPARVALDVVYKGKDSKACSA